MMNLQSTSKILRFLFVFAVFLGIVSAGQDTVEYELVTNITSRYDVNARPVVDATDAVNLQIGIALQQIVDLDEPTQVLTTNVFLRLFWDDPGLTWDPADFHNITSIRLTVNRIWRPDIALYNDVSTDRRNVEVLYPATVTHEGRVAWLSPTIFVSSCTLNMRYFPWDEQECDLELGSWTYDSSAISISKYGDGGDISVFIENGEWELIAMPSRIITALYACCANPFESIMFTIKITRKPLYYMVNIVLPCVFVSFVGLLVFLLPPASGEKVSLSVTILLASTVFLLLVAEALPPQSTTIPLVSRYFEGVICLLALSCVASVFILNIHHRGKVFPRPPSAVRYVFFDILARIVFMRDLVAPKVSLETKPMNDKENKGTYPMFNGLHETQNAVNTNIKVIHVQDLDQSQEKPENEDDSLQNCKNGLRIDKPAKEETDDNQQTSEREWTFIAMIIDRVLLFIFLVVTCITSLAILLNR